MDETEKQLIAKLKAADRAALERWYRAYQPAISQFVRARVSDPADAQELVQETFISSLKSLPSFGGQSRLQTWMLAIARHEVKDFYRKKYAKKVLQSLPLSDWLLGDFLEQPLDFTLAGELREQIESVLERLGAYSRELLLEKYLDGMSVRELAARRGKTPKAVESELYRARRAFRKEFEELDD